MRAYEGDAKVLLAFSLDEDQVKNLAGFTIACKPDGKPSFYLFNQLQLKNPEKHAQNKAEPPISTINAPIQKFRWVHVPGSFHQGDKVFYGEYTYTVTPRYFDKQGSMLALDKKLSKKVTATVKPFKKEDLELGFTRGFVQSQGFVHRFGAKAPFKPKDADLIFDTNTVAGKNADGDEFTFLDEYQWSGFTAREKIFSVLHQVQKDKTLSLDVFAYDLNEPDILKIFLELGKEKRMRIILDDATLHHSKDGDKPEDEFEKQFRKVAKDNIIRGNFSRYQHNKVFIVKRDQQALSVLCGSTNFSVTGMYVNSNHVAIFRNKAVATIFSNVFNNAWKNKTDTKSFENSGFADKPFPFEVASSDMTITFSPHEAEFAGKVLDEIKDRIEKEFSSVFFAVMQLDSKTTGPIPGILIKQHSRSDLFTAGITDSNEGIRLYKPSSRRGVLVTGKTGATLLPKPFEKEASIGIGHQVHHKFVVCGFNQPNAVVWFGSSNLALGGEKENGDQLIQLHDKDVATVFAIEALALVDHFHFRNNHVDKKKTKPEGPFFLYPDNRWAVRYYDINDLHYLDRLLFIGRSWKTEALQPIEAPAPAHVDA